MDVPNIAIQRPVAIRLDDIVGEFCLSQKGKENQQENNNKNLFHGASQLMTRKDNNCL